MRKITKVELIEVSSVEDTEGNRRAGAGYIIKEGTMATLQVGFWVRRNTGGKWHLVESVIAGDAITRCGRRLADETSDWTVVSTQPLSRLTGQPQLCKGGCDQ